MADAPLLSVLVLTLDGLELLRDCLRSLEQEVTPSIEVLVVDNGSTDGTADYVRAAHPGFGLLELGRNRGYAGGNNRGIRATRGRNVLLLNNDTVVEPGALARLIEFIEEAPPDTGGCMPLLLFHEEPDRINAAGVGIDRKGTPYCVDRGQPAGDEQMREIFCPHGAAALYRRSMLDQVGLLDERFFAFQEEVDLGWRARLQGWRFYLVPQARVLHHEHATARRTPARSLFLLERNRCWLLAKNAGGSTLLRLAGGLAAYELDCLRDCWWRRDTTRLAARAAALRGLPAMLRRRRRIQRLRRTPESELRRWIDGW